MPPILGKRDVVLAAETGSGKTLAYLAPLLQLVLAGRARAGAERHRHTAALVLCPSSLLCEQVGSAVASRHGRAC